MLMSCNNLKVAAVMAFCMTLVDSSVRTPAFCTIQAEGSGRFCTLTGECIFMFLLLFIKYLIAMVYIVDSLRLPCCPIGCIFSNTPLASLFTARQRANVKVISIWSYDMNIAGVQSRYEYRHIDMVHSCISGWHYNFSKVIACSMFDTLKSAM